ncbi:MAG: lysylphosphatidylglycerol synthase transmembrane domain-containing protein [Phototrophicaceae bacterium]
MKRYTRWIVFSVGLLVSALFLTFAFAEFDLPAVRASLQTANLWLILAAMCVYLVAMAIIALRWSFLLRAVKAVPLARLFELVAIGYFGNNVYPFRAGEALRIYLLGRNHAVPYARGATTVLVERVFDGLVMLTFVIVPLAFLNVGSAAVERVALWTAPPFLIALAVFFTVAARPHWLHTIAEWVASHLPQRLGTLVRGLSHDIIAGLEGLRSPLDLLGAVVCSYLSWAVEALVYWLVSIAFGLGVGYPLILLLVGTVNLAGLIPAAPGMIGVFQFFTIEVLTAAGVATTSAQAYSVAVHVAIWLPPTLTGLIALIRQGFGVGVLTHTEQLKQTEQATP